MEIRIKLNSLKDYGLLYQYKDRLYIEGDEFIIDLSNHGVLLPEQIIFLTLFITSVKNKGYSVSVVEPLDTNIKTYFRDIGIREFCQSNYMQPKFIDRITSNTAMPLWKLDPSTMNDYIIRVMGHIKHFCKNKSLEFLDLSISELINNVDNHAHSSIGAYIFCQIFPIKGIINIAIGDMGIGIPNSVNSYLRRINKEPLSSTDCLKWAISENKSTKSTNQNRGVGLHNLYGQIKKYNGKMKILSNNAKLSISTIDDIYEDNSFDNFSGTIVTLSIPIENLDEDTIKSFDIDF